MCVARRPPERPSPRSVLVLVSGYLPDTIMVQSVMSGQEVFQNGGYGNFIAVNGLIKNILSSQRSSSCRTAGVIHSRRSKGPPTNCTMSHKMWVYMPWLEELGLDVPTTTEEFHDMLIAFKDGDPNRTGRADTIPLTGVATGAWQGQPLAPNLTGAPGLVEQFYAEFVTGSRDIDNDSE